MNSSPNVAIVIPCFNGVNFLEEAIVSCITQSYDSCRVIVIDDKSSDRTAELLSKYESNLLITVITNQDNKGKPASLNHVLSNLKEPYIALLDHDDVMYPNRIERQVAFMEAHPEVGATSGFIHYINSSGDIIGQGKLDLLTKEKAKDYEMRNEPFALFAPCVMLRTEIVSNEELFFRSEFWPADDIDMWNRIYEKGWQVIAQPEVLTQYRIHSNSVVTSDFHKTRRQFEYVRACMQARRRGDPEPSREEFEAALQKRAVWQKINHWRKVQAKGMYRAAGFAYAEKKYVRMANMLAVAGMLEPVYVIKRLRQQKSQY